MAANSATSGSFSERREAKRLESVDLQDDEDESEATERSTSVENIKWDKVLQSIRTNFCPQSQLGARYIYVTICNSVTGF